MIFLKSIFLTLGLLGSETTHEFRAYSTSEMVNFSYVESKDVEKNKAIAIDEIEQTVVDQWDKFLKENK